MPVLASCILIPSCPHNPGYSPSSHPSPDAACDLSHALKMDHLRAVVNEAKLFSNFHRHLKNICKWKWKIYGKKFSISIRIYFSSEDGKVGKRLALLTTGLVLQRLPIPTNKNAYGRSMIGRSMIANVKPKFLSCAVSCSKC